MTAEAGVRSRKGDEATCHANTRKGFDETRCSFLQTNSGIRRIGQGCVPKSQETVLPVIKRSATANTKRYDGHRSSCPPRDEAQPEYADVGACTCLTSVSVVFICESNAAPHHHLVSPRGPDGDIYEAMRDTWLTSQIMTGRRHFPIGPANVVASADPPEDAEMRQHIIEGRLEGDRISAAESLTVTAGPWLLFQLVPLELWPVSRIVCVVDVLLIEERTSPW